MDHKRSGLRITENLTCGRSGSSANKKEECIMMNQNFARAVLAMQDERGDALRNITEEASLLLTEIVSQNANTARAPVTSCS